MAKLTQAGRVGELKTPLGDDVLVLIKFEGVEGLGELFEFYVDALSEKENIDFDEALGQSCTLKLKTYGGKTRIYDGILTQAQWIGKTEDYFHYRLVLRPWAWLLAHKADCRIFLEQDVKDIIRDVFIKAGFSSSRDFEFRTTETYEKIPYCVQYRETDLAFVTRLMEEYGIYYFFEHDEQKHNMILADSGASHLAVKDLSAVPFRPVTGQYTVLKQHLVDWISERRFRTGKVQYNDYDYLNPKKNLLSPKEASENYAHSKFEVYDYPGKYDDQDKGKKFAQYRLEAEQALDHRRFIAGDAPSLYPGGLVTVEEHPTSEENRNYLIVRAAHRFSSQHYRSNAGAGEQQVYIGNYEFLPAERPFRMLPLTPKPRIHGVQTAVVVGKKGSEEINTDEHGHIWVQFYWDREPKISCPVRVAHAWSGKQWGTQFIPRVGMEAVVEFLEGDPDRPLVTGCVYNGTNKVPYDLPGQKTQSGTKSDSSQGHDGYNEFMFEDKKGSEFIRMHAEKDHLVTIKADQTGTVGGDQSWTITGDRNWKIQQGDDNMDVKLGDQNITVDFGSQNVSAMQSINLSVCMGMSTVVITPGSVSIMSPVINL
ncbi:MAG TPA: type VI secretion system tip protein TssI/VgrG, partial [Chitinophagaceae bacterium]